MQSDFHTLTQHVMQFHIQGYKCQKKNGYCYSMNCFIIKLSTEITKDWKGREKNPHFLIYLENQTA